jgi:hypothetical protein
MGQGAGVGRRNNEYNVREVNAGHALFVSLMLAGLTADGYTAVTYIDRPPKSEAARQAMQASIDAAGTHEWPRTSSTSCRLTD